MGGPYISVKPMNNGKHLLVNFGKKIYSDKLLYRTKGIEWHPSKSYTPQNTKLFTMCHLVQGTCEHGRRRYPKRIEISRCHKSRANEEAKRWTVDTRRFLHFDYKWPGNPQRNQNWLSHSRHKSVHTKSLTMLPLSNVWPQQKFCNNEQKCAKWGQTGHEDQDCENEIKCANCDGDHPVYTRNCPKWKTEKEILKRKFQNNISIHEGWQQVEGPATDPSKNSYANVTKPHQWTNSIKNPNIFTSEEEWLPHTIDSLLKRLAEIKNQKSNQNEAPCTSSASQPNEITSPVSTQITPEQRNESTISNSRSALPPTNQLDASAASDDENEMESISASSKRGRHDSSDEEPNSPVSKKPASGSPGSGWDGTHVSTGSGRGDPSKISTFCPNPPRPGGQGSSGGEWSPIRPPDNQKHKAQTKPSNQSKSRVTKLHL